MAEFIAENPIPNKEEKETVNNDVCISKLPTEKESLAMQLRRMMESASPEDKCKLCKAAETLEKQPNTDWTFPWMILIMMLLGTNRSANADYSVIAKCMESMNKNPEMDSKNS